MSYDLGEIGFLAKYDNIKQLIDIEVTPLVDILVKLSSVANNFSQTANRVANIDIRETHEIKEFLELTFDARKLAEKIQCVVEFRTEVAIQAAQCCYYESKPPNDELKSAQGGPMNALNSFIAAGNKNVHKDVNVDNSGKSKDKKQEKGSDEKAPGKPPDEKASDKPKELPQKEQPSKEQPMRNKDSENIDKENKKNKDEDSHEKK